MKDHACSWLRILGAAITAGAIATAVPAANPGEPRAARTVRVTGAGFDDLRGAIVHSKRPTATGLIQVSTATVELSGDLHGRVLYQVTTVIDQQAGTLANTGDQVFSGTVAGSDPVMLHDARFRFDENLKSGTDRGSVYLVDHIAGPQVRCTLQVTGTGKDGDGNPTFTYSGECEFA
ncbi:MAG: hypothetical protein JSR36_02180 [Proteobacteria bacterium]|nr:hypothetical protein [Pseudomonadota bacterium]